MTPAVMHSIFGLSSNSFTCKTTFEEVSMRSRQYDLIDSRVTLYRMFTTILSTFMKW
jgi:hypothetical protein